MHRCAGGAPSRTNRRLYRATEREVGPTATFTVDRPADADVSRQLDGRETSTPSTITDLVCDPVLRLHAVEERAGRVRARELGDDRRIQALRRTSRFSGRIDAEPLCPGLGQRIDGQQVLERVSGIRRGRAGQHAERIDDVIDAALGIADAVRGPQIGRLIGANASAANSRTSALGVGASTAVPCVGARANQRDHRDRWNRIAPIVARNRDTRPVDSAAKPAAPPSAGKGENMYSARRA